jgi:hypothetical protein
MILFYTNKFLINFFKLGNHKFLDVQATYTACKNVNDLQIFSDFFHFCASCNADPLVFPMIRPRIDVLFHSEFKSQTPISPVR